MGKVLAVGAVYPLFFLILVQNSWVVDDAYITFRTVDNFLNGYGLRWNVAERVQSYTHPLWMFVMTAVVAVTGEYYFTAIFFSCFVMLCAMWQARKLIPAGRGVWADGLLILVVLSSKAVSDYASSGLENVLSYVLILYFGRCVLASPQWVMRGFFVAALAFVNRQDTLLLYLPMLLVWCWEHRKNWRFWARGAVMVSPAICWTVFALLYYGYLLPNTAYAKVVANHMPEGWVFRRGLEYLENSVMWDSASYVMMLVAIVMMVRRKQWVELPLWGGIASYFIFMICSGASGTHMSGRFFSVPMMLALVLFVRHLERRSVALVLMMVLADYHLWWRLSPIKFGTTGYKLYEQSMDHLDTKYYALYEGAALYKWMPGVPQPDHPWYHFGTKLKEDGVKVFAGGALNSPAIGYMGFAAGPGVYIVDPVALSDPLLAHLPAKVPQAYEEWRSGHAYRDAPEGYVEGLNAGENRIKDPGLHDYYDKILLVSRGDVFDSERLNLLYYMNTSGVVYRAGAAKE